MPRLAHPGPASLLVLLAACGGSDGAEPGPTTPPPPPPPATLSAPTGVTGTAASASAVRLTWTPVAGATAYVVQRAAGSGAAKRAGTPAAHPFDDAGLLPATTYAYQVAAVRGSDTSAFAAAVSVTTRALGAASATLRGDVTASRTLTADTTYVLSGAVKVRPGATLTIQPGTRLVGDSTVAGSLLMITRGARIDARGTAEQPIVFGSQRAAGSRAPGDWGGLVLVGNAPVSRAAAAARTLGAAPESYGGGADAADNSGTLRYVRLEFAGAEVPTGAEQVPTSPAALTLYAVGRGTTIEYVQALSSLGPAFQWFGGTVDARYLVSYESGDDHFAWAEGYQGRNQFVIGFQSHEPTPRAGAGTVSATPRGMQGYGCDPNVDGCATSTQPPISSPVFANFTLVGPGSPGFTAIQARDQSHGILVRRGSGATLLNGVAARWQGQGLSVREVATDTLRQRDSLQVAGVLLAENQLGAFDPAGSAGFANAAAFPGVEAATATAASLFAGLPGGVPTTAAIDWAPAGALRSGGLAAAAARAAARDNGFFGGALATTPYRGAAAPDGARWWQGWTAYARN
ncbi:fibronectin type III domain-containing protein [Roseisolibacter sp. H3M3-2]|uniref:fibronectin type III domain-containing protein n=1 Tax=Roseisolibacter sp. H3M3-2 TaxID=3031323 RepID=UPI0023DB90F6|nr:fibronectin type III domain-containing protein [Roseisolibacter sp. H3M3-2]MDF1501914.1 fibronectin type III domain-containing protein [Roseisolibacter sp. H3M3-2]